MTVKCLFDARKNKHNYYREIDCIEKLCEKLKNCAMEIINYEKREMIPLTDEETYLLNFKFYEEQEVCRICKKKFCFDESEKN